MSVDYDLNLGGNYIHSMGQAVALTQQYTDVSKGAGNVVGNLSSSMVALTQKVTGFNRVNTVATDTAAAYQKALAGIESTATVTGKSFDSLSKSTKQLARDFPIGMAGAVGVVESLQSVGVKSTDSISKLGKSFVELGAATGTNAASIGRDMVLLNKSMGNGTAQFEALSDSLVTVTKQFGASAPGTIAFSKALAPIASSVGLSQTSVMGLSAAMSSMGEDGFRAANTISKVMLDMRRAARDGGPELKAYADILGTTSENMRELFKANPTEAITRLTEAMGKGGSTISRQMETLGFDSVRDTRSLGALSRSGALRESVAASMGGYGSGATAKASEPVLGDTLAQADKLKETMSQTVANLGKPMLGIAKLQLEAANKVAGVMQSITGSNAGQAAGGVAGVGAAAGGIVGSMVQMAVLVALGRSGLRMIGRSGPYQDLKAGMNAARAGTAAPTSMAGQVGHGLIPPGMTPGGMGVSGMATRGGAITVDALRRLYTGFTRNPILAGMGQGPAAEHGMTLREVFAKSPAMGVTPEGGVYSKLGPDGKPVMERNPLLKVRGYTAGFGEGGLGKNLARAGVTGAATIAESGKLLTGSAAMAAGGIGAGASAMAPIAAVMGAAAITTHLLSKQEENSKAMDTMSDATKDIYGNFNAFAEAAGRAGKGLVSFTAILEQSVSAVAAKNVSMKDAFSLSTEEMSITQTPGYKRAATSVGNAVSARDLAAQASAVLGTSPSSQDIGRYVMDMTDQHGQVIGKSFAAEMEKIYGKGGPGGIDYESLVSQIAGNTSWDSRTSGMPNQAQVDLATQMQTAAQQQAAENQNKWAGTIQAGGQTVTSGTMTTLANFTKLYETAQAEFTKGSVGKDEGSAYNRAISELLGLTEDQQHAANIDQGFWSGMPGMTNNTPWAGTQSAPEFLKMLADQGVGIGQAAVGLQQQGIAVGDMTPFKGTPEGTKAAEKMSTTFETAATGTSGFTKAIYEATHAVESTGKEMNALPETVITAMGSVGKSFVELAKTTNEKTTADAGRAIVDAAMHYAGGDARVASGLISSTSAALPENMTQAKQGLESAQEQIQGQVGIQSAAIGPKQNLAIIRQGWAAQDMQRAGSVPAGMMDFSMSQVEQGQSVEANTVATMRSQVLAAGQLAASIHGIQRQSGIQMAAIARDGALKEKWATEDFHKQQRRSEQDHNIAVRQATQDKNIQLRRMTSEFNRSERYAKEDKDLTLTRMQRDYDTQTTRAWRDFNKQMSRAERDHLEQTRRAKRDFAKQEIRAEEDYNKQRSRSVEDYNLGIERAERDFAIGQTRATEDFNRGRLRQTEDYNKQIARMIEDGAKGMYDPYKRIAAQMVMDGGQLLTNLKDQAKAITEQVSNLAELRGLGMSEEAIKALSLADAKNAQQAMRLVEDARKNAALVGSLNSAVGDKNTAATSLVTDTGNTSFGRSAEDFALAQARAAEDFSISQKRMGDDFAKQIADGAIDFAKSMDRMETDYKQSVLRSRQDFTTMLEDSEADYGKQVADATDNFLTGLKDALDNLKTAVKDIEANYATARIRAKEQFDTQVAYIEENHALALKRMEAAYERQTKRMEKDFHVAIERMRIQTANAISDTGAMAGASIASAYESYAAFMQSAMSTPEELAAQFLEIADNLPANVKALMGEGFTEIVNYATALGERAKSGFDQGFQPATTPAGTPAPTGHKPPGDVEAPKPVDTSSWYDSMWPDNFDFLMPDIDWASLADNMWPDNWDFLFPDIDFKALADKMWPDNWDFLVPDIDWAKIFDFDHVARVFGSAMGTILRGIIDFVKGIPAAVSGAFSKIISFDKMVLDWLLLAKETVSDAVMGVITAAIENIPGWIATAFESVVAFDTMVIEWFSTGREYIQSLPGRIADWAKDMWSDLTTVVFPNLKTFVEDKFEDTVEWFLNLPGRIQAWATAAFASFTKGVMPDIAKHVEDGFNSAMNWITGLGKRIGGWIGSGWDALTEKVPELDVIKDKVVGAFKSAGEWVLGIGGWVKNKLGDGWDALWDTLPSVDEMLGKIKGIFGIGNGKGGANTGVAAFFEGFFDTIKDLLAGRGGSIKDRFMQIFSPIGDAFATVQRTIIHAWNALPNTAFSFEIPSWTAAIPGVGALAGHRFDIPNFFPDIPGYAEGGIATREHVGRVAEAGSPEAMIPLNARGVNYLASAFRQYLAPSTFGGGGSGTTDAWGEEYKQERSMKAAIDRLVFMFIPLTEELPEQMVRSGTAAIAGLVEGVSSPIALAQAEASAVVVADAWVDALLAELVEMEQTLAAGVTTMLDDVVADKDFVTALGNAGMSMTGLISDGMVKDLASGGATYVKVMAAAVALAQAAAAAAGSGSSSSYSGSGGSSGGSSGGEVHIAPTQVGSSPTALTKPWDTSLSKTAVASTPLAQSGMLSLMHWDPVKHMLVPGRIGGGPMEAYQARWVGEGGPELFLSSVDGQMVPAGIANRLMSNMEAKQTMVSPYSSPTTINITHTQDYSTKVTGPITVMSQDPNDMMDQLAAKARRSRLGNPVAGRNG